MIRNIEPGRILRKILLKKYYYGFEGSSSNNYYLLLLYCKNKSGYFVLITLSKFLIMKLKSSYIKEYNCLGSSSLKVDRITYFFNSHCVERISIRKLYGIWIHLGQTTQGKTNNG